MAKVPCVYPVTSLFLLRKKMPIVSRVRFNKNIRKQQSRYLFDEDSVVGKWQTMVDLTCSSLSNTLTDALTKRDYYVRVLLAQCDDKSLMRWNFVSGRGFLVHSVGGQTAKKPFFATGVRISIKKGIVFCNGKKLTQTIRLSPLCGYAQFNGVAYDGDFFIMPYNNHFLCINQVALEDYITAVLKTESWPGWPLEVNKVFAIACRSYVAHKMLEVGRNKRPFHVKNTNVHQTYCGRHDLKVLKDAVNQTRGVVLGFHGKPILAMFDSCCGGVIPAHINDFDFNKAPYLARPYACNFCQQSSLYSWQVSYEHAAFEALIKDHMLDFTRLCDVNVIKKDKAGLVTEVALKGPKIDTIISGKKLYSLLKDVKSFRFDMCKKAGMVMLTGYGLGHHLGLCQWGARQMVRDGWGYKSILKFYYPGVCFMQLR